MVDANEKEKAPKSESSPGKDEVEKDEVEKDEAPSNLLNDMEENEDDDDEDEYDFDDDDDDEEEEDDDGEEDEENDDEELEEEKVNDGESAVVEVKNEGLETNKENAVKEDGKKGEEPKSDKKSGDSSKIKDKRPKSRNTKKNEQKDSGTLAANGHKPESSTKKKAANQDNPESSNKKPESLNKKKGLKRIATMGMVFMCSSKTKADCFRYKILGLPESKKDQVLKIYQGMRLFLFDVDLRLMYGIFKAAGPGGYNIEPKAFKSEFPSQVRFTMLHDCLPLAEENFKSVLKENYYSRNKFDGLLKSDQVKKLCKLFRDMGKGAGRPRSAGKSRKTRTRAAAIETRRSRPDESYRDRLDDRRTSRAQEKRKRWARDEERRPRSPPPREKRRYTDYDRLPADYNQPLVVYDREPPVPRYLPPQPTAIPSPVRLYTYERQPLDGPPYIRDHVPEPPSYRVADRARDRDPYLAYSRDPPPPLYREPVYTAPPPPEYRFVSREYHRPSAVEAPDYRTSGGSRVLSYRDAELAGDYRPAAALPEYRSRTHYKYQP